MTTPDEPRVKVPAERIKTTESSTVKLSIAREGSSSIDVCHKLKMKRTLKNLGTREQCLH